MFLRLASAALASLLVSTVASGQCHEFAHDFALSGLDGPVHAYATYDDGSGPALYLGGEFQHAGELTAVQIVRWDGAHYSAVGGGTDGPVRALAVYDDGNGPQLYAAGNIHHAGGVYVMNIARWNGTTWSALGTGPGLGVSNTGTINALAVYDDGSGPKLYLAGAFLHAGGLVANNIARWSSAGWDAFTAGADGYPTSLAIFDEGSGPKLVVAGAFTQCGSILASNLAQYDGSGWAPLGAGANGPVRALAVYDDGAGPALVAGGTFTHAGGGYVSQIASWRNGLWSALGGGVDGPVWSLASFDEGSGERLFVSGPFTQAGGQPAVRLARWNGASWSVPGSGDQVSPINSQIPRLGVHDDGSGPALYVSTDVRIGPGTWTHGIARWDGASFGAVGSPRNHVVDGTLYSLAIHDDGSGPALHALGALARAGGNDVQGIARWDGTGWSALGGGLPGGTVNGRLASVQHAGGARLYAPVLITGGGTSHSELRAWDGLNWSTLASTPAGSQIYALAAYDDGNGEALYVGGNFHSLGGISANGIARFDGLGWSALGAGLDGASTTFGPGVLGVHDLGQGPVLVAGGLFSSAGGQPAQHVATWDGSSWSALGAGVFAEPAALATYDDGSGPALYLGGSAGYLARWDGVSWTPVPQGPTNWVLSLTVFDDGGGPALFVGGTFSTVGANLVAGGLARWNGAQWDTLGSGTRMGGSYGQVLALRVFDDGTGGGPDLYFGGFFDSCGGVRSPFLGKWNGCAAPVASFCHGDGEDLPCPCWNSGASGHGCASSANAAGALLGASGATNPDTLVLQASGEVPSALSIFLQGNAQQAHTAFGDGLRCVSGSLKRLYARNASGGSVDAPIAGELSISARSAALGDPISAGTVRYYQVYYRDPQLAFCPAPAGSSFNVTNGLVVHW